MVTDKLHQFYCSKAWRDLAHRLKVEVDGKCAQCNEIILDFKYLIGHHTITLTEDNIDNPNISLNPDLIEIICLDCHNKEHDRFGYEQKVYIVWGSPLSGKTTTVMQMMRYGDIVLDLDLLWQAVTMRPAHDKPDNIRFNLFALRDNLLDQIKTRYGKWHDAYVIGGYPDKYERERLAASLGAQCVYCESTKAECISRIKESGRPRVWLDYISDWWEKFSRYPP